MSQEDQIDLALECGMAVSRSGNGYWDNIDQLAAYTAAVEAKERERCAVLCEKVLLSDADVNDCASVIRSLKNE